MSFDITSVLKTVSESDTGKEQITYLDLDVLDPDENNFYSLDGIDKLADSIATVGLQQPIRVRRGSEPGRYTIVSGHRRRAACLLLRDSEDDREKHLFDEGVACIIERDEASPALQELRLIYANSATRSMTAADLSKQAERVEALLYQLQAEGMEFPGRMRDHVAAAVNTNKTKLARLHAIRKNLDAGLLEYFDRGEMPEETAYQLQRLPATVQAEAAEQLKSGKRKKLPTAYDVERVNKNMEKYQADLPCRAHAGGPDCHHKEAKILRSLFVYDYQQCEGRCCRDCYHGDKCSGACQECKDRRKLNKAVEDEREQQRKDEDAKKQDAYKWNRKRQAKRILPLIEAAGMKDDEAFPAPVYWKASPTVKNIRDYAAGNFGTDHYYDGDLFPDNAKTLKVWANKLNCSVDFLLDRADDPRTADQIRKDLEAAAGAPAWHSGTPTETGMYETRIGVGLEDTEKTACWQRLEWDGSAWHYPRTHNTLDRGMTVFRWVKLPEV